MVIFMKHLKNACNSHKKRRNHIGKYLTAGTLYIMCLLHLNKYLVSINITTNCSVLCWWFCGLKH
jgi:hypothetical protein